MVGDVGWELWESVFRVEKGGNYGWAITEGPQPIRSDIEAGPTKTITKPLVAYGHDLGASVTGGFVYRGQSLDSLQGTYLYGDYVTGLLWGLRYEKDNSDLSATRLIENRILAETGFPIISFAKSRQGEALVMSYTGEIYQLVPNDQTEMSVFPRKLSETGLFTSTESLELAPGVFSYRGAAYSYEPEVTREFAVAVPNMETIRLAQKKESLEVSDGYRLCPNSFALCCHRWKD